MAETIKKAKAPTKSEKTAKTAAPKVEAKKAEPKKVAAPATPAAPKAAAAPIHLSHEEVARIAHRYWAERGHQHGQHVDDWFRAEQELRSKAS